ncbi:MAG: hypothetical protein ACPGMR_03390 [Pontibacterium sp.]
MRQVCKVIKDVAVVDGHHFKVGAHGFVYRRDSAGQWIRSTKKIKSIHAALRETLGSTHSEQVAQEIREFIQNTNV